MKRALRAMGAAVAIVALLVGVPVLLAVVAGWPLPTRVPDWNGVYWQARQGDVPAEFIIKAFACVVWMAWAQIAWALLWELVVNVPRTLRGDPERHSPATAAPASRLAGRLVTAAMLLSALSSTPATTAAAPTLASLVSSGGAGGFATAPTTQPVDRFETSAAPRSFFDQATWVAADGDTLWDVAERCLGDGSRVDDILKCNPHLDPARPLATGARVVLPAGVTAPAGRSTPTQAETDAPEPAVQAAEPTATVASGDTLWGLTASHYGHVDADLVRVVADASGIDNPSLIRPGDRVVFPSSPVPGAVNDARSLLAPPTPNSHQVVSGDTLWEIIEQHYGHADAELVWAVAAANAIDDPSLIVPGQTVRLPPEPELDMAVTAPVDTAVAAGTVTEPIPEAAEETAVVELDTSDPITTSPVDDVPPGQPPGVATPPTTEDGSIETTTPSTTTPVVAAPDRPAGEQLDRPAPSAPSPIRLEHAALLAAGILALITVRRRQRLRAARPRHRVPDPAPDVVNTVRRLRAVDAGERAVRADVATRAAAWSLIETEAQIGWVEVSRDGDVELQLTATAELPAPWTGSGATWRLGSEVPIEILSDAARQVDMPCLALTQVGVTASGGELLTDLEACGTLAIEATAAQADEVVAAVATGLASSLHAEVAHLISVSLAPAALLGHRNAHHVESVDAAFELAMSLVGSTTHNDRSTFALRSRRTGGEMWEPAIVLLTSADASPALSERLLPGPGHGLAVVTTSGPGELEHAARVVAEEGRWRFVGFGSSIEFTPIGLTAADVAAIDEVLADADREFESMELSAADDIRWADESVSFAGESGDTSAHPLTTAAAAPRRTDGDGDDWGPAEDARVPDLAPFEPMPHEIIVGVFGPVEIVDRQGNPGRFERSKTIELIAWLATHRERATRSNARTALWEIDVRDATFANVVSEARRGLARLVDPPAGEEWVARTLTEQLPIHPGIVTDVQLIEERLDHARLQPPARAMDILRPGVAMIRDMPFAGTDYLWPDAEGITSNLVLLAMTAATEYAGHALSLGNIDEVFWATGQGLKVLAGHEELIALRMRAHARAGDLAGVRQEWESYERVLIADAWSDGEPAPKLLALRRELLTH